MEIKEQLERLTLGKEIGDDRIQALLRRRKPKLFNTMDALDLMLFRLIYTHEKLVMEGKEPRELLDIINRYFEYPEIVTQRNNIALDELSDGVNRLVVLLTHACQLDCRYCSVKKYKADMDIDTLKRAIDLLFTSKKDEKQLQFFGGEPLLRFELLKEGVKYAKSKGKVQFILTTNGVGLDRDVIGFLKKHSFVVEMSLDGDMKTQLKNRKALSGEDYYDEVISNMQKLKSEGVKYHVISVVTPSDIRQLIPNIKTLINHGFENIQINYALGYLWTEEDMTQFFEEMKKAPIELVNATKMRREPVVLNAEITVDCNGEIFLETGICLETDFKKLKKDFMLGNLDTITDINTLFPTRSRNFKRLVDAYSDKENFREIIMSNIKMGLRWTRQ